MNYNRCEYVPVLCFIGHKWPNINIRNSNSNPWKKYSSLGRGTVQIDACTGILFIDN